MEAQHPKRVEKDDYAKLIECAGLTPEQVNNQNLVFTLEVALEDFESLSCVATFEQLKTLTLPYCNIAQIEGLERLTLLEDLHLPGNRIQRIEGLDFCTSLKKLYLNDNAISRIEGLDNCIELAVLWISENQIPTLAGIQHLRQLEELNAASNQISTVAGFLNPLHQLRHLNLACNKLGSFKEILHLSNLQSLEVLTLNDPHYGENPVCTLCNYQTFVLYHINRLKELDVHYISQESKNFAEATFLKKKMYYNMRIKTIKRCTSGLAIKIGEISTEYIVRLNQALMPLMKQLRSVERELHELSLSSSELPSAYEFGPGVTSNPLHAQNLNELKNDLQQKHSLLQKKIEEEQQNVIHIEQVANKLLVKVKHESEKNIGKLIAELETGGNIRFEEGRPEDKWHKSCVDLISTRTYLDIPQIKVTRVTRIHNRFIRSRFEERMEDLGEQTTGDRRQLEYLFYSGTPENMRKMMEDGYDQGEMVGLVNSVSTAEAARLRGLNQNSDLIYAAPGEILICKVYIGVPMKDLENPTYPPNMSVDEVYKKTPINQPEEFWAVYRERLDEARQKVWFIFDGALVLPEYLVEFEYVNPDTPDELPTTPADLSELEKSDLASMQYSLYALQSLCSQDLPEAEEMVEYKVSPRLPERSKIREMTIPLLQSLAQTQDLQSIKYINLHDNLVNDVGYFGYLGNLETLVLSFNQIQSLRGLQCQHLKELDISFNPLQSLEGVELLKGLHTLLAGYTQLTYIDEIDRLEGINSLSVVNFQGTYLKYKQRYRSIIIRTCPALEILDNEQVTNKEKSAMSQYAEQITRDLVWEVCEFPQNIDPTSRWEAMVKTLKLEELNIKTMKGLNHFPNLRRLSLANNDIKIIEEVKWCPFLEELSLENNLIFSTEGIQHLFNLKKLDIGKNRLKDLDGLEKCEMLTQVSLEDNKLTSLNGLQHLKNLMELYVGNNFIESLKEIQHLKNLNKLIILDMSGNPMANDESARSYVIFSLKKLKVLDGLSIDPQEMNVAKDMFGGRLTEEILESRLGGVQQSQARSLDLSECKLRSFKGMFGEDKFPKLMELSIAGNAFQSLNCFSKMPKLVKLLMPRNKLESVRASPEQGLVALPNLETLDLSNNIISDLSGFQTAPLSNLRILVLAGNNLTKIEYLSHLTSLRELDLSLNKLRSLDQGLPVNLRFLRLDNNLIKSLPGIHKLGHIKCIQCSNNRINDFGEIDRMSDLMNLMELKMNSNPIARNNMYRLTVIRKLPRLAYLDDQDVTLEERERVEVVVDTKPPPLVHLAQQIPQPKVPVKLTAVNFDNVFKEGDGRRPSSSQALGGVLGITPLSHLNPKRRK